jgi:DNA ligase (NAD+)
LDIEGLGEETATLFVERGLVTELADLFDLETTDLMGLPGFAEKSGRNLVEAIERRKKVELRRFLFGLGIPEVGEAVARDLARHFGTLEAIRAADRETLETVGGIGPKMSELIHGFLHKEENARAIDAILGKGMELIPPPVERSGPSLGGRKFVFTGGLETLTRSEAKKLVEDAGGYASSSVSAETDFVVAGENAGSKLARAQELGVAILTEKGFLELLAAKGLEGRDGDGSEG